MSARLDPLEALRLWEILSSIERLAFLLAIAAGGAIDRDRVSQPKPLVDRGSCAKEGREP